MHQRHRERFLELLDEGSAAAVVFSGSPPRRNGDSEYRFRPESDFLYLTPFAEPEAALVLAPRRESGRAILFLRERDPEAEVWTGRRLGVEAAPETLGIDEARPIDALWEELPELLEGHERLVHHDGLDEERDRQILRVLARTRRKAQRGRRAPREWTSPETTLHELRLFKDAHESELMRRAAAISAEAHAAVMREAAPGKNERELDALLGYTFLRRGATSEAYTNIVAGGANACVLHYERNDQPLRAGELCLVDAGAEWAWYASDVTRTFPVDGRFSAEQRALYELVLRAQKAAIAEVVPGGDPARTHETAVRVLAEGLLELGLLRGGRDEVIEKREYRRFYMHKTGHWLGLDVHDCGAYFRDEKPRAYGPGMVTTVEPGLYVAADDETVEERWRGIGVRIEDDVLVTENGHEVLSAAAPKELDEVEAACRGEVLQEA